MFSDQFHVFPTFTNVFLIWRKHGDMCGYRSRRQDPLGDLLMSQVLRTMTNCALLSNVCLDLKGCLMTQEAQDGNWYMWIMRTTSCLSVMIPGSKLSTFSQVCCMIGSLSLS